MPFDFDCSVANGDPTGRSMPAGFPEPAQEAVIPSVVEEKLAELKAGKAASPVKVWIPKEGHPQHGRMFITDGQHRFVAACIAKTTVQMEQKTFGIAGFLNGWVATRRVDTVPAKVMLRANIARAQSAATSTSTQLSAAASSSSSSSTGSTTATTAKTTAS